MSSTSRAWIVAASVGTIEALKDQGFGRWSYTMKSIQHVKKNMRTYSEVKRLSDPSTSSSSSLMYMKMRTQKIEESEDSLRKVMFLSCWGPN